MVVNSLLLHMKMKQTQTNKRNTQMALALAYVTSLGHLSPVITLYLSSVIKPRSSLWES